MQFEFYVLNYDFNRKKVVNYNIFNNHNVQEHVEKEIKKYVHNPNKYKYVDYSTQNEIVGFEAICKKIEQIIKWQEWCRYEYEISVGAPFEENIDNLKKIDCYEQCKNNIPVIARECIYQYKQQLKENG